MDSFAQVILLVLFALLGDFITAVISWLASHSKKLAVITFVSAFIFQGIAISITIPSTIKESENIIKEGVESEKSYQEFAQIKDVTFNTQEPYTDSEIDNQYPEYGPIYKKLLINVPILVSKTGTYQVNVRYSFSKAGARGNAPMKEVIKTLDVGEHEVQIEFIAHEISSYGFWNPSFVGGIANVQISYLASEKELISKINPNSELEHKIFEQFLKDEGLDKRKPDTKPKINKFIERKEVHF